MYHGCSACHVALARWIFSPSYIIGRLSRKRNQDFFKILFFQIRTISHQNYIIKKHHQHVLLRKTCPKNSLPVGVLALRTSTSTTSSPRPGKPQWLKPPVAFARCAVCFDHFLFCIPICFHDFLFQKSLYFPICSNFFYCIYIYILVFAMSVIFLQLFIIFKQQLFETFSTYNPPHLSILILQDTSSIKQWKDAKWERWMASPNLHKFTKSWMATEWPDVIFLLSGAGAWALGRRCGGTSAGHEGGPPRLRFSAPFLAKRYGFNKN